MKFPQIQVIDDNDNDSLLIKKSGMVALDGAGDIKIFSTGDKKDTLVAVIRNGEFQGQGIYLSKKYNWSIGSDADGNQIAIPTKK